MLASVIPLFPEPQRGPDFRPPTFYERAQRWENDLDLLIRQSIFAVEFAFSYRQLRGLHPTRVARYGTAVMAFRPASTSEERFGIEIGFNTKLKSGPWAEYLEKLCSERSGISYLDALGYTGVHGLVTFSDNMQADDVSGEFCNIQQPCHQCRILLEKWLSDNAPIVLVRHRLPCDLDPLARYWGTNNEFIVETWTFGEICRNHRHYRGYRR